MPRSGYGTSAPPAAPRQHTGPRIPQPTRPHDIVGIIAQNTASTLSEKRIATFGQVFLTGQLKPQDHIVATLANHSATTPVQMDALTLWPDGSVKIAALALELPRQCAQSELLLMLARATTPTRPSAPLSLSARPLPLSVTLDHTATVRFQDKQISHPVSQMQYTAWHATLGSHAFPTPAPALNIQHDIA